MAQPTHAAPPSVVRPPIPLFRGVSLPSDIMASSPVTSSSPVTPGFENMPRSQFQGDGSMNLAQSYSSVQTDSSGLDNTAASVGAAGKDQAHQSEQARLTVENAACRLLLEDSLLLDQSMPVVPEEREPSAPAAQATAVRAAPGFKPDSGRFLEASNSSSMNSSIQSLIESAGRLTASSENQQQHMEDISNQQAESKESVAAALAILEKERAEHEGEGVNSASGSALASKAAARA